MLCTMLLLSIPTKPRCIMRPVLSLDLVSLVLESEGNPFSEYSISVLPVSLPSRAVRYLCTAEWTCQCIAGICLQLGELASVLQVSLSNRAAKYLFTAGWTCQCVTGQPLQYSSQILIYSWVNLSACNRSASVIELLGTCLQMSEVKPWGT